MLPLSQFDVGQSKGQRQHSRHEDQQKDDQYDDHVWSPDLNDALEDLGGKLNSGSLEALAEFWPYTGGAETSHHAPFSRQTPALKNEDILCGYEIACHAHAFGDMRNFACAIRQTGDLNTQVHCRGDLLPDRAQIEVRACHADHYL